MFWPHDRHASESLSEDFGAVALRMKVMKPIVENHYSSESVWRHPRLFARHFASDLASSRTLAWQLYLRNMRANYRQSLTGYAWALIPPLAWGGLFLFLRSAAGHSPSVAPAEFAAHTLTGLIFWQLFIESAQMPMRTFADARGFLAKIRFPREALVLAGMLEVATHFILRIPMLLACWMLIPDATPDCWWILPAACAALVASGCCVGVLLLPLSLLYKDVAPAVALACGFWLVVTPIGYPTPESGIAARIAQLNPATVLIETPRALWLGNSPMDLGGFTLTALAGTALAIAGWMAARIAFPHIAGRLGT